MRVVGNAPNGQATSKAPSAGDARSLAALVLAAKALSVACQALSAAGVGDGSMRDQLAMGELQGTVETLIDIVGNEVPPRDFDTLVWQMLHALETYQDQHGTVNATEG